MPRALRVLHLTNPHFLPPESDEGYTTQEINLWKTDYDVVQTLRDLGHEVASLAVDDELGPIREAVEDLRPHIVFNLLEEFAGIPEFDQHVVSYLELLGVPYTGCNPRGLTLSRGKALSKKIVSYHRIRTPRFAVFPRGRKVRRPRRLALPLIVKSLTEEASKGIAQASVVDDDDKLEARVRFMHESLDTDVIAEEFIEGRELYVGVLGNTRLTVLPVWELRFGELQDRAATIATAKVKHDVAYQDRWKIDHGPARDIDDALRARIVKRSKRVCRILSMDGYARVDYRLDREGRLYFLEANPNPEIAWEEEFASAAEAAGIGYPDLIRRIVGLGLRRRPIV